MLRPRGAANVSWVPHQAIIGRWPMVGTTGAKAKSKINDLCTLTGHSGALIAQRNIRWCPDHRKDVFGISLPEVAEPPEQAIAALFRAKLRVRNMNRLLHPSWMT
jgi:hypothetical protein